MSVNIVNNDGSLSRVAGGTLYADSPIGTISPFGGSVVPSGYLLCNGAEVVKTAYAELYAVIGDAFGTASDNTKFKLPDLREATTKGVGLSGKSSVHYDTDGVALGEFVDDHIKRHAHQVYVRDTGHIHGILYEPGQFTPGAYGFISPYASQNESSATTSSKANIQVNSRSDFGGESNVTNDSGYQTNEVKAVGVNYIIKAKQVAVPFDMAEYIRNQNILSAPEEVTLSNKQHTMEYDGIFTFSIYAFNASQRVKVSINNVLVINASLINYPAGQAYNSYTVQANKGDIITIDTTINLFDTIIAQYYKLRDYTGR